MKSCRTIGSVIHKVSRLDEPSDKDDHAMNVIKYMLSKLPEASEIVVPSEALPPKWKYWHEMSMEDYGNAQGKRIQ